MYQGQKLHIFSPSLSFLAEAQPRLENSQGQKVLLGDRTKYKAKDIIKKMTNLFCIYLFQIDKFINAY
jgi:hypothetical protein